MRRSRRPPHWSNLSLRVALRYHGWKHGVDGTCLIRQPRPPAASSPKIAPYGLPTREANGVTYAYLGPRELIPPFPKYEWTQVPLEFTYVTRSLLECNYLQGLEGECDSSHLLFLHRSFTNERNQALYKTDTAPFYETEDFDFGVRLIATRKAAADQNYVRFSAFVMPVYGCVPAGRPTMNWKATRSTPTCRRTILTAGATISVFRPRPRGAKRTCTGACRSTPITHASATRETL